MNIMRALLLTRKFISALALVTVMVALLPWRVRAEPMGPVLVQTLVAGGGRYVIANYTGPYFVIWDLERIWDRHQPTQVLVVQRGVGEYNHAMGMAISQDRGILAFQDWGSKKIYLCELGIHFQCHPVLEPEEEVISMDLSPLGEQLLLLTSKEVRLLATKDGELQTLPLANTRNSCLMANWRTQMGAVGSLDGNLHMLDLKSLKILGTTRQKSAASCQLFFTKDGKHLYANWIRESFEGSVFESHQTAELYDLYQPVANHVRVEESVYVVPGDQAGDLWYAADIGGGVLSLASIDPEGRSLTEQGIRIVAGTRARVLAVSATENMILLLINGTHFIYDLKSRLPIASLYASKVNYYADERSLPHLTPGLGADPAYPQLELLSRQYGMDLSLDNYTFPSNEMEKIRKDTLLWMASLVVQRGDRYDSLWFDLLPVYREDTDVGRAYYQLMTLCRLLIQLDYAENLLNSEQYERALFVSRDALRSLRDTPELQYQPDDLDKYNPDLSSLVLQYRSILERDLWLAMGDSLAYQGAFQKAELAFRGALRSDPREWKAYEGILRTRLGGDRTYLSAGLAEAQQVLKLDYWNGFGDNNYPAAFFLETEVYRLRDSNLTFPGPSLNWKSAP